MAARAADEEKLAAHAVRAEQERLASELRAKRERKWADELGEARRFADELKREGRRLLAEAKQRPKELARALQDLGREQSQAIAEQERAVAGPDATVTGATAGAPLAVGDPVEVTGSGLRGTLLQISGDRGQIARGSVRFDVPLRQLRRVAGAAAVPPGGARVSAPTARATSARGGRGSRPRTGPGSGSGDRDRFPDSRDEIGADASDPGGPPAPRPLVAFTELNLVGERVAPALERLAAFLDRALLEDRPAVRIIHGFGTGALRQAVREYLAGSAYVQRFGDADAANGGGGATIAELR